MSLDYNRISAIGNDDFRGYGDLLELTLSGNKIKVIGQGAFMGLERYTFN